jgi:hypothetical protein
VADALVVLQSSLSLAVHRSHHFHSSSGFRLSLWLDPHSCCLRSNRFPLLAFALSIIDPFLCSISKQTSTNTINNVQDYRTRTHPLALLLHQEQQGRRSDRLERSRHRHQHHRQRRVSLASRLDPQDHITNINNTAPSATTNSPATMGSVEYCAVALAAFLLLVPRIALEMKKESKQTRKKIRREQKERAAKRADKEAARRSAR